MISPLSSTLVNSAANGSSLHTALQRLGSGRRINPAADDAAGQAILTALNSQAQGQQQASRNAMDVLALADTASGALGQITDSLKRMRELAVQAANGGVYGSSDLKDLQTQVAQLSDGIDQTVTASLFNGQPLLDGRLSATAQTGANASQAISAIDAALAQIGSAQAELGGMESGFQAAADVAHNSANQTAASAGRLGDADDAATASQLSQDKLHSQLALKAVAMYHSMQQDKLALLKKSP